MVRWFKQHWSGKKPPRPVVTGVGIVSPIGTGQDAFWAALLAGRTGVRKISLFDATHYPTRIAAEVPDLDEWEEKLLSARQRNHFSRAARMALIAYKLAHVDSGLREFDPFRTAVVTGSASIAFEVLEEQIRRSSSALLDFSQGEMEPLSMLRTVMSAPTNAIALDAGIEGYSTTVTNACASALSAIALGADRIRRDEAEVVIAGGVDAPITPIVLNAHCAARLLTTNNEDPETVLEPFDMRRTKPVLGEGSAYLILEDRERALARGARIYAEIGGYAQMQENMNEIFPMDRSGSKWAACLKAAGTEGVSHISAHGPSDRIIDRTENLALKTAFGERAQSLFITSIKGAVGSGMASASALQVAAAVLSLKHQMIPPIYNYKEPDPECDLRYIPEAMSARIKTILLSSHGLGGINCALRVSGA
ncbi:MAG: beta-ketoacyl-[acyl-carrier-protein] synthase family protein [Spirochaetales bacterium]|nr:beta-ketoacyl-[acyl-carrier-protein] synthase family protein [Spirochaetales bacterium]